MINLELRCRFCGTSTIKEITIMQYQRYYIDGELAQNVFPDWATEEREYLISEMCPKCQEKIFGE